MGGICEIAGSGDQVIKMHVGSCLMDCPIANVTLGLGTGSTMIVEEVRLEWLPLSTTPGSGYTPPVARFFVQHFRDLNPTTSWTDVEATAYTVHYQKNIDSSSLQIYFSLTRSTHFDEETLDNILARYILHILMNGNECTNPAPATFAEYSNMNNFTMTSPLVLMAVCRSIPSGDVEISLTSSFASTYRDVQLMLSAYYAPRLIVEEIYDDYLEI